MRSRRALSKSGTQHGLYEVSDKLLLREPVLVLGFLREVRDSGWDSLEAQVSEWRQLHLVIT